MRVQADSRVVDYNYYTIPIPPLLLRERRTSMEAGDYILICGKPKRILRTNDRFVVVEGGLRLTLTEAERFKRSSAPSPEPSPGQGDEGRPARQMALL